jgi:intracellular sulfur oxidation DsrE/DsrF family protein
MILSKTVLIKTNGCKKIKYYSSLGYDINLDYIEVKIEDVTKSSSEFIEVKCDYCFLEHKRLIVDYNRVTKNELTSYACSKQCGKLKALETISESPKKPHPNLGKKIEKDKLDEIIEKRKKTNLEKWGVEHPLQNKDILQKVKRTNLEKWGVDNFSKSSLFLEKTQKSNLENWGVSWHTQNELIKQKIKKTNLEKWNKKSTLNIEKSDRKRNEIFKSEKFRESYEISNHTHYLKYLGESKSLFKCRYKDHEFEMKYDNYKTRFDSNLNLCTICNPVNDKISISEKSLFDFIKSVYKGVVIQSWRDKLEVDIYLPDIGLGFEFNGIWWHSDKYRNKDYHSNKIEYFKERNIRIFNIWEDDWKYKRNIIESQIKNLLNLSEKISARKCEISIVKNNKIVKEFLNENHIQGWTRGVIHLGLFFESKLVGMMSFDKYEGRKKMSDGEWNLSRFCNKSGYSVVGGASKLLRYFEKLESPKRIISYADKDWSIGDLYYKLEFNLVHETKPDYKYVLEEKRIHKSRFRKSLTGVSEKELTIPKVFDSGKIKFEKFFEK